MLYSYINNIIILHYMCESYASHKPVLNAELVNQLKTFLLCAYNSEISEKNTTFRQMYNK